MSYHRSLQESVDCGDPAPVPPSPLGNVTFFATRDFVGALLHSLGEKHRPLAVPVRGSGPPRILHASQTPAPYCSRYVSLAPFGLYASPGWNGHLELSTVEGVVQSLMGPRTRGFVWNVRFDHEPLAVALVSLGLTCERVPTRVLHLKQDYEHVFAGYSATIRNHVRKARQRGVLVRSTHTEEDVHAYFQVHLGLVRREQQKQGYGFVYPIELLLDLVKIHGSVRFLLAEWEGKVIAGAMFLRDGCSVYYFHGASDRDYSHLFPSCAVFDEAIRWACESGAKFVDLTDSAGIASLEKFKASWGACRELNWRFEWSNPLWVRLSRLKARMSRT